MFDVQQGPLAFLEPDQVRPMPTRPSFEAIVANGLAALPGLDARAASARNDLAASGGDPSDGFDSELAGAIDDSLEAPGNGATSDAADTIATGDNLDVLRQSVSDVLPSSDSPVTMSFDAPPAPPSVSSGKSQDDRVPPDVEPIQS